MLGPIMMDLRGAELSAEEIEQLRHPLVGGVILFARNFRSREQITDLCGAIRARRPELLIAADTEGGRVQRFREGFSRLPAMAAYGRWYERDRKAALHAATAGAWLLAAELRAVGVDLAFAPVLDLDGGISAIIGDRALHARPRVVAELGAAVVQGMAEAGMAATGKHFPGHGWVAPDSHTELPVDHRLFAELEAADMLPFAALIAGGLPSIMMAHIRYPAVDEAPASFSETWVHEILRGQLNFRGAIFCDDLSMGGALGMGAIQQRAEAALAAGCDMLPICNQPEDTAALLHDWHYQISLQSARRLARLRGAVAPSWESLQASERYTQSRALVERALALNME